MTEPAEASARYFNRELSWLDFNERVLAIAEDGATPILERAKFLAIFADNLDEFFQVRVAGLKEQQASGVQATSIDGQTASEQLHAIRLRVEELYARVTKLFHGEVAPGLDDVGVRFSDWASLDAEDQAELVEVFHDRVFPVLTPLAVDPGHPFPYISNLSLNLAVFVRDPDTRETRFARVKVPPILPRFLVLPDGERFVPLEQVIAAHLDHLFPGMQIGAHFPFRVTRNADLVVEEEEAPDLLAAIETELTRQRFGRVVRLEVEPGMSDEVLGMLTRELGVAHDDVYVTEGPLDFSGLWALHALDRPELKWDAWTPVTPPRMTGDDRDLFAELRHGDLLVHHPYDSFTTTVEAFIARAARDPHVLAIKQTLYRTSDSSPIVRHLITAAEEGKQVVALVELKARFDEEANIGWARRLEEAGVHVVYGLVGLKTHAKTALVVRDDDGVIRRYAHIGTGNYNEYTASVYEDVGLFTTDADLGADLTELFNHLTGYSRQERYRSLLVAPGELRDDIVARIRAEAAEPDGHIVFKVNAIADEAVIDALYEASQAGVRVDLIVRGICCLRPGVPGLSDNIGVRSVVGRYLEHSRLFRFGSERRGYRSYIGSADLMPRNLDRRVEALTPVRGAVLERQLDEIIATLLADDVLAWELGSDGVWAKVQTVTGTDTHLTLQAVAQQRAHG